jgi:hypothetical protein
MQSNELDLDTIVKEYFSSIGTSTEEEGVIIKNMLLREKIDKELCKKKLRWSKEFFRFCLNNTMNNLVKTAIKLAQISNRDLETGVFELKFTPTSSVHSRAKNYMIDMVFEKCVALDIMKGQQNDEAIAYLKRKKNAKSQD